jgi:hypothetical protein
MQEKMTKMIHHWEEEKLTIPEIFVEDELEKITEKCVAQSAPWSVQS